MPRRAWRTRDATAGPAREPEPEIDPGAEPEPRSLEVHNPATGELIRSVAVTDEREVEQKVERARRAQPAWAARSYEERADALRAFRDLLEAEAEECARITTREMGKPIVQARNEVRAVLDRIDWNIDHVGAVIAPRTVTAGGAGASEERVTHEPVGLVAHVSAWNYPYFVGLNTIVPALLTGNAVLYKPSEHATLTGLRLVDLMHRSGIPVDVVQAIVGGGAVGAALVASDVDMVCFTGSYETGRRVARSVADRLVRLQLELGGKDGAYVCDDVDVESTALAVAEGAFYNGGQSCSAIERVYVHDRDLRPLRRRVRRRGRRVPHRRPRGRAHRHRPARARRAARRARRAGRRRGRKGRARRVRRASHRPTRFVVRADRARRRRPDDGA